MRNLSLSQKNLMTHTIIFKGVGLDGMTATAFKQGARRYTHDITPELHVLVVNASIPDTIPLKEMIVLLGLTTSVNTEPLDQQW